MTDHRCEFPGCEELSTEFIDINDEDGVNVCIIHNDAYYDEIEARRVEGPTLTSQVKTPMQDWLETRPYPFPEGH